MRLKKLNIHNIASIADAEIDFEGQELRDESVFLICGETGSGKTTILDAICLALYNRTPRLAQASMKDSYTDVNGEKITLTNPAQYLKKGTWEAEITLTFEAGGRTWEACWKIHRAGKNAEGKLQATTWEITDTRTGISEKGSEIERIVGLSFDEFRRTTMLAQGDFTAFLKSRDDEKSAILEKITGTGIYKELGRRISEAYKDSCQRMQIKNEQILGIRESLLDEDTLLRLSEEIKAKAMLTEEMEKRRIALEEIRKGFIEQSRLKSELKQYKDTLDKAIIESARLKGGILYAEDSLKMRLMQLAECESYITERSGQAETLGSAKLIAAELDRIEEDRKRISALADAAGSAEAESARLQEERRETEKLLKAASAAYSEKEAELNALKATWISLEPDKLSKEKEVIETICRLQEECENRRNALLETEALIHDELVKGQELKEKLSTAVSQLSATEGIYEKLMESNRQWAKDARASLKVGEECPVCRQKIQTEEYLESISEAHFESLIRPVAVKLEESRKTENQIRKEAIEVNALLEVRKKVRLSQKEELETVSASLERLLKENGGIVISRQRLDEICLILEKADSLKQNIDSLNQTVTEAGKNLLALKEKASSAEIAMEKANGVKKANMQLLEETERRIAASNDHVTEMMKDSSWIGEWDKDHNVFRDRLLEEADAYSRRLDEKLMLQGKIEKIRAGLETIRDVFSDIVSIMPVIGNINAGEKVRIERLESALSNLKAEIMTVQDNERKALNSINALEQILEGHDEEVTESRLAEIYPQLTRLNQDIGSMSRTLELHNESAGKVEKQLKELEAMSTERDQWKALNDVFGKKDGEYFQKIAQSMIMNDILSRANHYLKSMTDRYILESQQGSLNIIVRDMEQGGIPRSTSTVSGGESFVISLALALGLSSSGNGRISSEVLFIDEGFGSLSEDYLNTVIETLQKLHDTSGKKVGIISHIEQLRQRICTKIIVSKTDLTTSKVDIITGN